MMEWARKEFPWSKVADQWTKEMESKWPTLKWKP
jgi:hypothetical protein